MTWEVGWPDGISSDEIFSVEVAGQKVIRALAIEPLMNSLERWGLVVPAICRSGEYSACRVRLLSGEVFMPEHSWVRESDRKNGYIHTCVSYPLGDLKIRV